MHCVCVQYSFSNVIFLVAFSMRMYVRRYNKLLLLVDRLHMHINLLREVHLYGCIFSSNKYTNDKVSICAFLAIVKYSIAFLFRAFWMCCTWMRTTTKAHALCVCGYTQAHLYIALTTASSTHILLLLSARLHSSCKLHICIWYIFAHFSNTKQNIIFFF